ncbi:DUF2089 domain-containing protein [Caldisericum exile]|uniref:DUF2089 domain-containing protein n=1 Tax=Caldisericum exile (strain DSM 21853 / NBRC 104410 / AZM16c01) TaxID=511051 RepID=A0A7U6GEB5_CALEA|nr:DUF2089 domain-containing protein [Caldisericum exile]BAL80821.1 hypothetical protein CSE_06950 [Caldisericum exile AZM16c01]
MRKKIVSICPVCGGPLTITELKCNNCGTVIQGNFEFDRFMLLDDEDREFLIEFLRSRGNIKEVQARLDISYPTAKARLDKLLKNLDLFEDETKERFTKSEVLSKLERGEITVDEAIELLREAKDE